MKKLSAFLLALTFIGLFFVQTTTSAPAFGDLQNGVVSTILQKPDSVAKTTQIPMQHLGIEVDKKVEKTLPFIDGDAAVMESPFQAVRGTVTMEGLLINSTSAEEGPGNFTLRPLSYSKGEVNSVSNGTISIENDAVLLNRGNLTERFTASTDGIRQDFIISSSPAGTRDLSLVLELKGARAANSLKGVSVIMDNGRKLEYHRLFVTDALGNSIPGEMIAISENLIGIKVHDLAAVYPLTIDPTITDADWVAITGFNDWVRTIAVSGTDVYVGGNFTSAGGVPANRIARWNGSSWSAFGYGLYNTVNAIAVNGSDVYLGGEFTWAGSAGANYVAKWNGSSWSALGSGTNLLVNAIAVSGTDVYVGGYFTSAGGVVANRIAKWDGSAWSALGTGLDATVYAIAVSGTDLYVGGSFSAAGGVVANRIAKWNGSSWSALGVSPNDGTNANVYAIAVSGTDLYAGGSFSAAGGIAANYIAKWNGSDWSALGTGLSDAVHAIAVSGTDVYVGGEFQMAAGVAANHIAKWDGSAWSALGSGTGGDVLAMAMSGTTELIVGGSFTNAGVLSPPSPYLAKVNLGGPPTITSFTPTSAGSGATVTITGTNFTGATAVSFGGTAATSFIVVSATSITAVVANGTTGTISVVTPGGTPRYFNEFKSAEMI